MNAASEILCRGSWALGTACGKCERCMRTWPAGEAAGSSLPPPPPPPPLDAVDDRGRTVLDRLKGDLTRATQLNHSVAVVRREDLRTILEAWPNE